MNTNQSDHMPNTEAARPALHGTERKSRENRILASVLLSCTAILMAALITIQAGHLTSGNAAHAEMATTGTEYTLITTQGGNEEMLYVLEARTGNLLVYEPSVSGMRLLNLISVGDFTQPPAQAPGSGN
ncbi:MAG: hypothetical protein D8M59_07825 [Planctomycetes bacterium]|nr:hypothetical protein [Planctomycetota bacterium]NOG53232.1 hypothetical protein [Planctomycetota bacterium]